MGINEIITKDTLRSLRIKYGYTQKYAASLVGVSAETLRTWEQDSSNIPYQKIKRLEEVYNVSQSQIFFGKESAFSEMIRDHSCQTA